MDALMDFALIDIRPDSDVETTAASSTAPVAIGSMSGSTQNGQNQNQPSTSSSSSTTTTQHEEMATSQAKLVEDLAQVIEQSLEKFENRIAGRLASEVINNQQAYVQATSASVSPPGQNSTENYQLQNRTVSVPLPVHENVYCDHCNTVIVGIRYKCGMCKDYDLCERCESQRPHNQRSHLFVKIYEPLHGPFNTRPLLAQELGATNSFACFLGSLGLPTGTEATLEVVREDDSEVEIRELAQANGCQFYLSDNGRRLCKDYQAINKSSRDLPAGEYRLEHVFSTGLHPLEAKIPLPNIPEGDVRIICLSWQAPSQCSVLLLGAGMDEASNDEDDAAAAIQPARPLRQATSVYRLKNRQGRHIGEPINASLALLQLASPPQQQPPTRPTPLPTSLSTTSTTTSVQTDNIPKQDDDDDSFEIISDAEYDLPSCFVLNNVPRVPHQLFPPPINAEAAAAAAAASASAATVSEACLIDVAPPPPPRLVKNLTDRASIVTEAANFTADEIAASVSAVPAIDDKSESITACTIAKPVNVVTEPKTFDSSSNITAAASPRTTNSVAASGSASAIATDSSAQSVAKLLSQSQSNEVHPSALLAASYVPKASSWVPPPPTPRFMFQQQQQPPLLPPQPQPMRSAYQQQQQQSSFAASQPISSTDIWGPRGEESQRLQLQKLLEMGFYRKDVNSRVMQECNWDFDAALNRLSIIYEEF